ncbi:MAG: heparinase II/III family protein [bacterium]|nr:heparinase II/III family protein [bacterium]
MMKGRLVLMTLERIDAEMQRRADWHRPQTHLIADYYRIRRKIAYPLPLREMILPNLPVAGIAAYPWSIWVLWDFEERVNSLGWVGTWFADSDAQKLVVRDLDALASWPCYRQYERPDLSLGHCARLMWQAYRQWPWLGDVLRAKIEDAFGRMIADALPYSDEHHGAFATKSDILLLPDPHSVLHNIPLIGTVGIALAAHTIGHEAAPVLDQRLHAVMGAILDLRESGHSEGVGYDGYIMDFIAHWLQTLNGADQKPIIDHPRFNDLIDESIALAAPGDVANVAKIGDVEPREMPYHLSAHAKLWPLTQDPRASWLLAHCRVDWLRADALAAMRPLLGGWATQEPFAGALDAHYATVVRSGWEREDLAVVMSTSNSPMGHLQNDSGSLLIGSHGRWLIDDPGYQQYLKKTERAFTLGASAHNTPVINGHAQVRKLSERGVERETIGQNIHRMTVDLTACYPESLALKRVARTVWAKDKNLVVVLDEVSGETLESVNYHWHGHPDAAWWVADNWARIYFADVTLWVTSPQAELSDADIDRLPGSRGQLTLCTSVPKEATAIWWVFKLGGRPPSVACDGRGITIEGQYFNRLTQRGQNGE